MSHLTLTYGISTADFIANVPLPPKNILSLSNVDPQQEIDIYSGFNMYLGEEAVKAYLSGRHAKALEWIDFDSVNDLEFLAPREVSELLYLGHAYTHLKAPFYYKLQNSYVFLTLPNGAKKVYYRYLPHFYQLLAKTLAVYLAEVYREKRLILRSRHPFLMMPSEIVQELTSLFSNGVVFDYGRVKIRNQEISIPMLTAPESVYQLKWHEPTMLIEKSKLVGKLHYYLNVKEWKLEVIVPEAFEDNFNF
ncbi:hypothetical protein FD46_GL000230 [Liquorilactobacillus oeni DSM 19972]|uniref:Uncharacterized protein n=1 Tax=Liquorilactobacillus oeni DSM 19972 TaxID=1423777 RepID=A0A0R1MJT8_9LACO|nr:hypothetical protein FD46_GL000230 [Liquorilactobacillus oeni DSM 19972]